MNCGNLCTLLHSGLTMHTNSQSALRWVLTFAAFVLISRITAQEAIVSTPEAELNAPVLRESLPQTLSKPTEPTGALFRWGPVSLHPHLLGRAVYGLGLPSNDGRHVASMIYTMAPGLQMDLGQSLSFDYTPTWTTYTARALDDTVDHSARVSGAWEFQDWTVKMSENYRKSSPLLIETGGQTPQRTWATKLEAGRSFGSGLGFQTTASLDERDSESFPDTRDWSTMNWLTLRFTSRIETGLGLGAGYSDIVGEPDVTNERYMGRVRWVPTDKLSLDLDAGLEARHSRAAGAEDANNPIYNASLMYRPFEVTQISLGTSSAVSTAYYQNQVTESASWTLGVQQRLIERFYLMASFLHKETDFSEVSSNSSPLPPVDLSNPLPISLPGRSDQVDAFNGRIYTTLFKHWKLAATFAHSRNRSNQESFTYNSTQYGFELSRRF